MSLRNLRRCGLLVSLLPMALGVSAWEGPDADAALAVDGQCETAEANGSECALNALQFRGRKVLARTDAGASDTAHDTGSCRSYGCARYVPGHACQCNSKCREYGDCCSDYDAQCLAPAQEQGSCKSYSCSSYVPSHSCQCNAKCRQYGDCCSDYDAQCLAPAQEQGSCKSYNCSGYVPGHACQCNEKCRRYGDCCSDYEALCVSPAASPPSSPEAQPARQSSGGKVFGHPSASTQYPSHPGFTLMLAEEFDGPIDLDADPIWTWSDGGLSEGQARFMKENINFQDGKMVIELRGAPPEHAQPCSHAEVEIIPNNKTATSGEIRTRHNMFRYGRYEVRMKAPTVQPSNPWIDGNFIATMFVFRDAKFKHWREIDVEVLGDSSGTVSTNVITGENIRKFRIDMDRSKKYEAPFNVRADFHTYAFEWLPDRITWFVDGKVIREERIGDVPIPELPGKIIMNLWEFDRRALFGGKEIWNDRLPMRSEYDWFRFYKWDGDAHYPCAGMAEHCLTEDDLYLSGNNPCDGIPQVGTVFGTPPCTASCLTR